MIRRRFVFALMATALVVISSDAEARKKKKFKDKDCDDFTSQKKAQKFFKKNSPRKDPHDLDSDGDGTACEELD